MMLVPLGNHLDQSPDLDVCMLVPIVWHFARVYHVMEAFDIQIDETLHLSYLMLMHPFKCITWSIQDVCNPIMSFLLASFSALMRFFRVLTL